jgi:putative ABC transport system permease protein
MDALLQDLRYAVRSLRRSPGFAAVAVLTLAFGIGVNTAIFSAVDTVLLRPLPYPQSDRLLDVASNGVEGARFGVSYPDLQDIRGLTADFSGVAAYFGQTYNLSGAGDPREVRGTTVTADLFGILGAHAILGRTFTSAEGSSPVAVLSYGLWQGSFGGDRSIVGKGVTLDGISYTVVGVLPPEFRFPDDRVEVWTPIGGLLREEGRLQTDRNFHAFNVVARLAPNATLTGARTDLAVLAHRLAGSADSTEYQLVFGGAQGMHAGRPPQQGGFLIEPLQERLTGNTRDPLLILFGAVALVLLIACANAANLLLARASIRRREIAIRQALGASRSRLIRQLLTESVLLALAGAIVGVALASWGLATVLSVWPQALPRASEIGLDGRVLGFTTALGIVTGLAFGLIPAWRASAAGIEQVLRDDAAGAVGGRHRLQNGLVVAEVALALVLVIGAGLLLQSYVRLSDVDPGFDAHDVLAAHIRLTPARYPTGALQTEFFRQVLAPLQSEPSIASASLASTLPLSGSMRMLGFDPHQVRPDATEPMMFAISTAVTPGFFAALHIPVRHGRSFTDQDRIGAPPVVMVNEAMAKALWPGQDPVDRAFPLGGGPTGASTSATVIGVVPDLHTATLEETSTPPGIYLPALQSTDMPDMWVLLRSRTGHPLSLAGTLRTAVHQADPGQPIGEIVRFDDLIGRRTATRRFNATLLGTFALLALGLALVGIYGLTSYGASRRTRELGIRMALGARAVDVERLLLVESFRRVALGVGIGLAVAFIATRVLAKLLWGVGATDPATYGVTALVIIVVALAATWFPARRATRIDPMVALRAE